MEKIDLKKQQKHLYQPSAKAVVQVEVPTFTFLMVDGEGDPNTSQEYAQAVEALFSVSYTAKFMAKKGPQKWKTIIRHPMLSPHIASVSLSQR